MSTRLALKCEACGGPAVLTLQQDVLDLLSSKVSVNKPCPACGGALSSPGGYYRKNAEGVLVRLSAYSPPSAAIN
ncbi:MAG: hypothetical protein QM608_10435 [Caulobacter sp.]